jgi:hypothetical protein
MKEKALGCLTLFLMLAGFSSLPAVQEQVSWWWVGEDERADHVRYLESWPEGRHAGRARRAIDDLDWQGATAAASLGSVRVYLLRHPQGVHAEAADVLLDTLQWAVAEEADTVTGYQEYVGARPASDRVDEAHRRIEALRRDETPYLKALEAGSESAVRTFLDAFPGHARTDAAQQVLIDTRGRDVVDLIEEGKLAVESQGSGIDSVSLKLQRKVDYQLTVRVPVGTFFVSRRASAQNMVATAARVVELASDDWIEISVEAACANRPLDIPEYDDAFRVARAPRQAELRKLMPVLEAAGVGLAVRQAAVWIVTDDADYSDLGILVQSSAFTPFGGTRMIHEAQAARALKILSDAGIDVRQKSIWFDRDLILDGLEEGELRTWLKGRS